MIIERDETAIFNIKFAPSVSKTDLDDKTTIIINVDNLKMYDICSGKWTDVEMVGQPIRRMDEFDEWDHNVPDGVKRG